MILLGFSSRRPLPERQWAVACVRATHLHTSIFMSATAERAMGGGFRRNSVSELKLKNRRTGSTWMKNWQLSLLLILHWVHNHDDAGNYVTTWRNVWRHIIMPQDNLVFDLDLLTNVCLLASCLLASANFWLKYRNPKGNEQFPRTLSLCIIQSINVVILLKINEIEKLTTNATAVYSPLSSEPWRHSVTM